MLHIHTDRTMEPYVMQRVVYEGSDPSDDWVVVKMGHSNIQTDKLNIVQVQNLDEYSAGCTMHDRCLGHMCQTPSNLLLPPQSLAISSSVISNDVHRAAAVAFQGPSNYHKSQHHQILANSMKKKTGRMRKGVLNCHVDGSLRMVISPQWDFNINVVAIPSYLRHTWIVARLDEHTQRYTAEYVKEGDRAILVRPPSLTLRSVQPVVIQFWNETCLGVSPYLLKAFDGDYDGDEMHVYPVYSAEAVRECDNWHNTPNPTFDHAQKLYEASSIPNKCMSNGSFIYNTTLSFNAIAQGISPPHMAEQARVKLEHVRGVQSRFDLEATSKCFIDETIRGMADINTQQLSQPIVGDMSRIARIAASCVLQQHDGTMGLMTTDGFIPSCRCLIDEMAGNSAVRGVSIICAASQQVALDAHRAGTNSLPSHDLVKDMIKGSADTPEWPADTLLVVDSKYDVISISCRVKYTWMSTVGTKTYLLCKPANARAIPPTNILGTYNPTVLGYIHPVRRMNVCTTAINELVAYYSLSLSESEVCALSVLFTYRPGLSKFPITTREGIASRSLHWVDVTMATHYSALTQRLENGDMPMLETLTASSCLASGNFRDLS